MIQTRPQTKIDFGISKTQKGIIKDNSLQVQKSTPHSTKIENLEEAKLNVIKFLTDVREESAQI